MTGGQAPVRIGILLYEGFDLLDAGGPYEVFLTAARLRERSGGTPPFEVLLVSPEGADAPAYGGMVVTSLAPLANVGALDVLVVPGTIDLAAAQQRQGLVESIRVASARTPLTASVCTGAFLLAWAGLLGDAPATTHWEDMEDLAATGLVGRAVPDVRWVDRGSIVTSGGLTAGIDMSLHLVERFAGRDLAVATAMQLAHAWDPEGGVSLP